jgi:Polysaccharide biosynthesis enzyme WcbI
MKLAVYGNCQVGGFAASLRSLLPDSTVDMFPVSNLAKPVDPAEYDLFFLHKPFANRFNDACADRMRLIPSIVFTGFHPDCAYVDRDKVPIHSPVGPLNSALVAACFLCDIPLDEVPSWFTHSGFDKIGYLAEFERAKRFLLDQARALEFDLSEVFDEWMRRREAFMYTLNHPAVYVLYDVCRIALAKEGLTGSAEQPLPPDGLAKSIWWPVYNVVAEHLGITERAVFKYDLAMAKREGRETLGFTEFVAGSYQIFKDVPRAVIAQAPAVARVLKRMELARCDALIAG